MASRGQVEKLPSGRVMHILFFLTGSERWVWEVELVGWQKDERMFLYETVFLGGVITSGLVSIHRWSLEVREEGLTNLRDEEERLKGMCSVEVSI